MIKCTKCKLYKEQSEFYKDKQKSSGYRPDCKTCNKSACTKWAIKNPEKRKYYVLKAATGVSKEQYLELLSTQNYKCAICNKNCSDLNKKLSVDHDHITNNVRGLLCGKCNMGLGYFNDNKELLNNAIKYLSNNQSSKNIKFKNAK